MFAREDWSLFRNLATLPQKAGIPLTHLRRLVAKELVDKACDATAGAVRLEQYDGGLIIVEDDGPGLDGTPTDIAALFSVRRPLTSSKLLRLPTRGALGNGLRVVAGAVLASGGLLYVGTRGQHLQLVPQEDGSTRAVILPDSLALGIPGPTNVAGTRIAVRLGDTVPADNDPFAWATITLRLHHDGTSYKGKPSPYWFDSDSFHELCLASGQRSVRALVAELDGCTGARAGEITAGYQQRRAADLTRAEAETILLAARNACRPLRPERLGAVGKLPVLPNGYARVLAELECTPGRGALAALVPVAIEAWAEVAPTGGDMIMLCVNRTPVTADVVLARQHKYTEIGVFGCGLQYKFTARRDLLRLVVNVQAPYLPLTSDGKAPDLSALWLQLAEALERATRQAKRPTVMPAHTLNLKDASWQVIPQAYTLASAGDRRLPANARQVMYAARGPVQELTGGEIWKDSQYFTQKLLPQFVEAHPTLTTDWDVVYDDRGHIQEPHTQERRGIGTIAIREYTTRWTDDAPMGLDVDEVIARLVQVPTLGPRHRYGAALFVEKEGFEPLWEAVQLRERFNIAIMSTKGMSVTAARQLVEALSAAGITIYVMHDFDKSGFSILHTLRTDTTRYKFKVPPRVVDLGLRLEDVTRLRLQNEQVTYDAKKDPRRNLQDSGASKAEANFLVRGRNAAGKWYGERVELNAMTSDQLVAWVEAKLQEHSVGKVVPDEMTLRAAWQRARKLVRARHALEASLANDDPADLLAMPSNLSTRVMKSIDSTALAWDDAIWKLAQDMADEY